MFSNSILAGEELVRTAIRSANYVAGVSGWRIDRNGNAEFNGGIFRGSLLITGPNGTIHIYDDPTLGVVETFTDQAGGVWIVQANVDGSGNHEFSISGTAQPAIQNALFALLSNPGYSAVVLNAMEIVLQAATDIILTAPTITIGPGALHVTAATTDLSTSVVTMDGHQVDAEGWTAPALLNGWNNLGGVQPPVGYRQRGQVVDIRGVVAGGTINQPIFVLPAPYRPAFNHVYPGIISGGGTGQVAVIAATGQVNPVNGSTVAFALAGVIPLG